MSLKVSIVVPTFNSAATLVACLNSIIHQTYKNKEVIVIDGQSTDNTLSILKEYQETYPFITCLSEKDNGVYDAMNKGIEIAKGDYLFFIGSDDEFYSNTVLENVFSDDNESFDFIYGDVFFKYHKALYSGESSIEKLIGEQISICHQAIFYKKNIFNLVGRYDLKYFIHADYDLNVKCFEHPGIKKKYIPAIITLYNEQGISGEHPNKDCFHDHLTLHYITHYVSPFELILKIKSREKEIAAIKNSTAYKIGIAISTTLSKIKKLKMIVTSKKR
jgi:glycosyltransferase involved in cell wall biosynthesis